MAGLRSLATYSGKVTHLVPQPAARNAKALCGVRTATWIAVLPGWGPCPRCAAIAADNDKDNQPKERAS